VVPTPRSQAAQCPVAAQVAVGGGPLPSGSVAARLDDFRIPAGKRLEVLKGDQAGRYSVPVNDRYRVTFRWEQGHAYEVRVEDCH